MDTTQFLLSTVLTVSTLLVVVVGIQLVFVLREFRLTMRKFREFLADNPSPVQSERKEVPGKQEKRHTSVHSVISKMKFFSLPKSN